MLAGVTLASKIASRRAVIAADVLAFRNSDVGSVTEHIDLRTCSRWRIGGPGRLLIEPKSQIDVSKTLILCQQRDLNCIIIGHGSNLLFDDAGFRGVIVRLGHQLSSLHVEGEDARVEAGVWTPSLVRRLGQFGLRGLEHAIGIPGTFGGLVMMNGGSRRHGVGSAILRVRGCDMAGKMFERDHSACQFRYRGSTLQDEQLVVLEADLSLERGDPHKLHRDMLTTLAERRRKFPKELPNCGSVFLSNPAMYNQIGPPGAAIEAVGLKGTRFGDAQISERHANFIVNVGSACSRDVLRLIYLAQTRVHDATGYRMDVEVRYVDPDGTMMPADVAAQLYNGREKLT